MNKVPSKATTKARYEKLYGRPLTEQELFTIKTNLLGFFTTLIKIDQQTKRSNPNER